MNKGSESYEALRLTSEDVKATLGILEAERIQLRQDDGTYHQMTVSVPKSLRDALVVGIRYRKRDSTYTEDHFLFQKGNPIARGAKKKWLENLAPEYRGTHKKQL